MSLATAFEQLRRKARHNGGRGAAVRLQDDGLDVKVSFETEVTSKYLQPEAVFGVNVELLVPDDEPPESEPAIRRLVEVCLNLMRDKDLGLPRLRLVQRGLR